MFILKKLKSLLVFFLVFSVAFLPTLLNQIQASGLKNATLVFERMQVETSNTNFVGVFTPSANFSSGSELKISFPDSNLGDWCKEDNQELQASGIEEFSILNVDNALPGTLGANCFQHVEGDYVIISGIENLQEDTSYGFELDGNENFYTGPSLGENEVSFELSNGSQVETASFNIYLLSSDTVSITAQVSSADSVICTISTDQLNFGTLHRGGSFITASHTLGTSTTAGSQGYYWSVFGQGNEEYAGLYDDDSEYIIKSLSNTVDLLAGEGFGLVVEPPTGTSVSENFQIATFGVFGSIGVGFDQAKLLLYRESEQTEHEEATVTLGVRASLDAVVGSYQEILTYSCGGYVGGSE